MVVLPNADPKPRLATPGIPPGRPLIELSVTVSLRRLPEGFGMWERELEVAHRGPSGRPAGVTRSDDFPIVGFLDDKFLTRLAPAFSLSGLGKSWRKPSTLLLLKDKPSFAACWDNNDFLAYNNHLRITEMLHIQMTVFGNLSGSSLKFLQGINVL